MILPKILKKKLPKWIKNIECQPLDRISLVSSFPLVVCRYKLTITLDEHYYYSNTLSVAKKIKAFKRKYNQFYKEIIFIL